MKCRVKNWALYQHYKDRNPPWVKLHFGLLSSQDWVMLADASRVLMVACMLLASRNDGEIDGSPAGLAFLKRVAYLNREPDLKPLIDCGFLEVLADASECKQMLADARPETETETETEEESESLSLSRQNPPPPKSKRKPPGIDFSLETSLIEAYRQAHPGKRPRSLPDSSRKCVAHYTGTDREVTPERMALVAEWVKTWRSFDPADPPEIRNLLRYHDPDGKGRTWGDYLAQAEEWDEAGRPAPSKPGTKQSSEPSWVEEYNNVSR